jgi:hypothetical protein
MNESMVMMALIPSSVVVVMIISAAPMATIPLPAARATTP